MGISPSIASNCDTTWLSSPSTSWPLLSCNSALAALWLAALYETHQTQSEIKHHIELQEQKVSHLTSFPSDSWTGCTCSSGCCGCCCCWGALSSFSSPSCSVSSCSGTSTSSGISTRLIRALRARKRKRENDQF